MSKRSSAHSDTLVPPASPYPAHVVPSPTDSNGTDRTDIEDDAQEHTLEGDDVEEPGEVSEITSPKSPESVCFRLQLATLKPALSDRHEAC